MNRCEPVLTASLYCSQHLDSLVHAAVGPFLRGLREQDPGGDWSLWMVRYSRCGEHLKVRLHGPRDRCPLARRLLAEAVQAHFDALPAPVPGAPRASRGDIPAIDEDDEREEDYPDRTLSWTRYRRSHVSLGPAPFLDDDRYAGLMAACLASAADLVLDGLRPDASGQVPHSLRQRILLRALVAGLSGLDLAGGPAAYLAYHRDWLLRFYAEDADREEEVRGQFDARVEQMPGTLEPLRRVAAAQLVGEAAGGSAGEPHGRDWPGALAGLHAYLAGFRGDPAYHVDPFAPDPVFPPIFKVFHGLANQLGLSSTNEAFVHHLLLRATAGQEAGSTAAAGV
ncbi:MAG: lantibiotic dehydratase C-terminal domain-containing protein [Longimicrobiaceae bacterium]